MHFHDVQHQERAVSIIRRGLRSGRTPHAYLFEGPEGVGKEMAARALAARLLCLAPSRASDQEPCGECDACRRLAADRNPDFHLIHRGLHKVHPDRAIRASKGLFLSVHLIRHFLIEPAGRKPTAGPRHVFLIRDAERMNEEAQNALLKTLEEPPGDTVLILVTSSAERLLPTIRSRCQRVPFGLLPPDFIRAHLEQQCGAAPVKAAALSQLAGGRLGAAVQWHRLGLLAALPELAGALEAVEAGDPEAFGQGCLTIAGALAARALTEPQEESEAAEEEGDPDEPPATRAGGKSIPTDELRAALKLVFLLLAALYRDALVRAAAEEAACHLPEQAALTSRLAAAGPEPLQNALPAIVLAERMLDQNVAPQLVCERLAVALRNEVPAG